MKALSIMDDDRRPVPTATNKFTMRLQCWPPTVFEREHGYRRFAAAHKMK